MKSITEIEKLLLTEVSALIKGEKSVIQISNYYNETLGDISFILAGLLEVQMQEQYCEWFVNGKWIDDILIGTFEWSMNTIEMSGIVIWGKNNTTEQWTDPFMIKLELSDHIIYRYNILFGDIRNESLCYTDFRKNRNYWKESEVDWMYIINRTIQ